MQYDRQLTISAAGSRHSTNWQPQVIYWSELVERLRTATRGTETLAQYLSYPKSQQDDLKDVGGFVAGALAGGRRKAGAVTGRDVITLDLDNIPAGGTADVLRRLGGLGCAYAVYSTRKHEEAKPRLRVLAPLDRTVTADEYEPLARKLAAIIGIELCDPTTFQVTRLMYWPSCCADSQYVFTYGDKPFVSADGLLGLYADWRNIAEWPQVPGTNQAHVRMAAKQGDPTTKPGIVGAFCRVYDVPAAIATFLPGVYEPADDGRLTYVGGSTTGGAIVYDDGQFLYSHHATDPTSGRLVNAFDLVRLHKFGDQDDDAKAGTPTNKLPSYAAMTAFAMQQEPVAGLLMQERYEKAVESFGGDAPENPGADPADMSWIRKLDLSPTTGKPSKTVQNVAVALENDPALKGRIYRDTFTDRLTGIAPLPWPPRNKGNQVFIWADADDAGLRSYIERVLGFRTEAVVRDAFVLCAENNAINPVEKYLNDLAWDGVPRLDRLYIDYLGAEDCPFIRTIARKAMVAAVARAMTERVKFDYMTVVCGPQGIGKSTLFRRLGKDWFSDSLKTFEGKEAEELIQGKWIVEIAELQAFNRVDVNRIKQFLSKMDDQYREAYGRNVKNQIRRSVFFGTTNDHEYLHDPTGNRRFWPVDARPDFATKKVFSDLTDTEIDQIWAEAVMRWRMGEPIYLTAEMEAEAERRRQEHMVRDPLEGIIESFINKPVPEEWQKWGLERRLMYWGGGMKYDGVLVERDRVCAAEIWRECLNERRSIPRAEALRINAVLSKLEGWERASALRAGADYGVQKGFKRKPRV